VFRGVPGCMPEWMYSLDMHPAYMYLYHTIVAVAEHGPVQREARGIPVGMEVECQCSL
jgi:hypothetical protein